MSSQKNSTSARSQPNPLPREVRGTLAAAEQMLAGDARRSRRAEKRKASASPERSPVESDDNAALGPASVQRSSAGFGPKAGGAAGGRFTPASGKDPLFLPGDESDEMEIDSSDPRNLSPLPPFTPKLLPLPPHLAASGSGLGEVRAPAVASFPSSVLIVPSPESVPDSRAVLREKLARREMYQSAEAESLEDSIASIEARIRDLHAEGSELRQRAAVVLNVGWRPRIEQVPDELPPVADVPLDTSAVDARSAVPDPGDPPALVLPENATLAQIDRIRDQYQADKGTWRTQKHAYDNEILKRASLRAKAQLAREETVRAIHEDRAQYDEERIRILKQNAYAAREPQRLKKKQEEWKRNAERAQAELSAARSSLRFVRAIRAHMGGLIDELYWSDRQRRVAGDHDTMGVEVDMLLELIHARSPPAGYRFRPRGSPRALLPPVTPADPQPPLPIPPTLKPTIRVPPRSVPRPTNAAASSSGSKRARTEADPALPTGGLPPPGGMGDEEYWALVQETGGKLAALVASKRSELASQEKVDCFLFPLYLWAESFLLPGL